MTDIALTLDAPHGVADLVLAAGDLATDAGLRTAILVSLFTDARARADDALPEPNADRRGWWGDFDAPDGDETGSRLWLLGRAKATGATLRAAEDHATAALAWLTEDGVASAVDVVASSPAAGVLALAVILDRPNGPARQRYDFVWEAS